MVNRKLVDAVEREFVKYIRDHDKALDSGNHRLCIMIENEFDNRVKTLGVDFPAELHEFIHATEIGYTLRECVMNYFLAQEEAEPRLEYAASN